MGNTISTSPLIHLNQLSLEDDFDDFDEIINSLLKRKQNEDEAIDHY